MSGKKCSVSVLKNYSCFIYFFTFTSIFIKKYALKKSESNKDFKSLVLILFAGFLLRQ